MLTFFALIIGILFGTITGLIPGIHINQISVIVLAISSSLPFSPIVIAVFIVSMSITHTFTDFLPSIFLGSPDEDSALSVLPGHKMLQQGKAYQAVLLTIYGSIAGIFITLFFIPVFIFLLPKIYPYIEKFIVFILLLASLFLIIKEKNKLLAMIIFLLAGSLGALTLNLPMENSLLPLLTGLFGASTLSISLIQKTKVKKQIIKKPKIKLKAILKSTFPSFIASPLVSFLPSLGASQAAIISLGMKKFSSKQFLILLGSINTIVMGLSFLTLYTIKRARTGSALAVSKILPSFSHQHLFIIVLSILIASIFASYITIYLAKILSKKITKINYQVISLIVLIFISIITIIFSGLIGFLIFILATGLGIFCIISKVRRTQLMGALMIPTILFYIL